MDRNVFLTLTVPNVPVALRKESVDRNTQRRDFKRLGLVALRKESVDRNDTVQIIIVVVHGRSPQGERG